MKGFIKNIKFGSIGLTIISIVLFSATYGGTALAEETGGYPWADAVVIRASTYDWGYEVCQPAMIQAKTCSAHYGYNNGVTYHESDPWKYDVRNCTSFVAWRANQTYQLQLRGWGDAKKWPVMAQKAGYAVSKQPHVGDIAVWNSGTYGHVAFVLSVNIDNSVNVEQYNRAGKGEYSRQSRVRADNYIHVAPVITPKPAIEVPNLSQTVIQSVTTSLPVKPLPEPKKTVEIATVTTTQPPATNPPQQNPSEAPATSNDVSYFVESTPKKGMQAYAVKYKNTKSGKVEVHTADVALDASRWSPESMTPEVASQSSSVSYAIADQNADGFNDMYQVTYSGTISKKVEVSVLDGAHNYASHIGKWTTEEQVHNEKDVSYAIADQNGDAVLDLYQIWQDHTSDSLVHTTVFDGQSGFKNVLDNYALPEAVHSINDAYYMVGDHNDDGIVDVYQIWHDVTPSGKTEIKVFDGSEKKSVISRWTSEQALYSGSGPNVKNVAQE